MSLDISITPLLLFYFSIVEFVRCLYYRLLSTLLIARFLVPTYFETPKITPRDRFAVLVTGASTGIGADVSIELAKRGFIVFATVRRSEDGENLKAAYRQATVDGTLGSMSKRPRRKLKSYYSVSSVILFFVESIVGVANYALSILPKLSPDTTPGLIEPVLMDVTDQFTINVAHDYIEDFIENYHSPIRLIAIVNNAGIAVDLPVELTSMETAQKIIDVNFLGSLRVTLKFLGLLKAKCNSDTDNDTGRSSRQSAIRMSSIPGRIVFISSVAGRLSFPGGGVYAASKHAIDALAHSLRLELTAVCQADAANISVSVVEPGMTRTKIWSSLIKEIEALPESNVKEKYGDLLSWGKTRCELQRHAMRPWWVSMAVVHALTSPYPKTRYVVGADAKLIIFIKKWLPDWFFQLVLVRIYQRRIRIK